jgi:hypothetical protein
VRDDFSAPVIRALAGRVGYRCSHPSCPVTTIGPSDTRAGRVTQVGIACHITAAAPGGTRYDGALSPEERASEENGIWLCATHSKIIDDDADRYTASLLRSWKQHAEEEARPTLFPGSTEGLVQHSRVVERPGEQDLGVHAEIHEFLADVGADAILGDRYQATRMLLTELTLNAFTHGGAQSVTLAASGPALTVADEGLAFGLEDLRKGGRGGADALRHVERDHAGALEARYRRLHDVNEWTILDVLQLDEEERHPCGISVVSLARDPASAQVGLVGCQEVHLYVPDLWTFSDLHSHLAAAAKALKGRRVVIHGLADNPGLAASALRLLPEAKLSPPVAP